MNSAPRSSFVDEFASRITGIHWFFFYVALRFGLETLIAPQLSIAQASCRDEPNKSKNTATEKPSNAVVPFFLSNCPSKKAAGQPNKQGQIRV